MARHDFTPADKRLLAERVGFHCSNPSCGVSTIGPSIIPNEKEYVGVAAHIYSASIDNGPRANPSLSEEERSHISNAIHLCNKCSTIIDKNKGTGYSAEVLFGWKSYSEDVAKSRIYIEKPFVLFKTVNFQFLESDYSTALSCTGLNEKNVESCPSSKAIISDITNKLQLANKCIIKGCSGSGKSLLTYQVAYNFYKQGYAVFNIHKELFTNNFTLAPPQDNSVLVIDDAQILDPNFLEVILSSAYKNCLILANWNSSTSIDDRFLRNYPFVEISPISQVKMLEKYCLENKDQISETLKLIGLKTNKKDHHDRIDARIFRASRESTPWLFNYSLTEGWNAAKQDLDLLENDQKLSMAIVTVAIFQFATLDNGVSKQIILTALKQFNNDNQWLQKAETALNKYCVSIEGNIKNKHYEYSRRVLKLFLSQNNSADELEYLLNLIALILKTDAYLTGHSNLIEFVMFDFRRGKYELNTRGITEEVTSNLLASTIKIQDAPAIVTKLNSLIRLNKDVLSLLKKDNSILEKWLLDVCRKTAYQLGNLINTLCNEDNKFLTVSEKHIKVVFDAMVNAHIEDRPRFAYLLNRMQFFVDEQCKDYQKKLFETSTFEINISAFSNDTACYQFSKLIDQLACINSDWADEQVKHNIKGISELLNKDLMSAYSSLSDLISHYFGVTHAILGIERTDSRLKKRAKCLARELSIESILQAFESLEAVDVQSYCDILIFLALYDEGKLKEISNKFNYNKLYKIYESDEKLDHFHKCIISILQNRENTNYQNHIAKIVNKYNYVNELFVVISPEFSFEKIKSGMRYQMDFDGRSECKNELIILKAIMDEENDETLVKRILQENIAKIADSIFNKAINVDNKKAKFDLLVFIHKNLPSIFNQIVKDQENVLVLIEKIRRLIKGKKQEKMFAQFYVFLLKNYSSQHVPQIAEIEKQYPSITRFDITQYE
ncbi:MULTISPECIES: hypothetical protein [unclassified Pseudoalteromonas]|uniref:nSTAND3 domain-containing NTPase n=1 Tax=unclassified Pseudoalteromonas TaxID=194690 RepID=UPI0013FE1D3E|nr:MULTISPECIES: hypothetical protein [unclassified Pseudoalteromonas]MBG9990345.1 hypothetical protein [Pseudoalteromonas sp. NZS37]